MRGWMLAAAVALAGASAAAQTTAADEAAAVRYLEATGHRFSGVEPSTIELAPIVNKLSGARVIGMGEVTHGTHEDVAFKALLFRELVKAGAVDTLAIEANRVVGVGFDRYVREGIGDPATAVMSPSAFKIYKNDEFAGTLLWLRAWNLAHPDRMIGVTAIDDQDGAVDAAFALEVVARHEPALAARLRAPFGDMIPPTGAPRVRPSDWIAAHNASDVAQVRAAAAALSDALKTHASEWGRDPDYGEAEYAARLVVQNIRIFEEDTKGADITKHPPEYWSRRDRFMAENLIERLGPRGRAALWAHDDHVMHTFLPEWTKQGATALGVEVRRRLGEAYRTIGFTYSHATLTGVLGANMDLKQMVAKQVDQSIPIDNTGPDTTGRVMARLPGEAWWFDTAAPVSDSGARRWLAKPAWSGGAGWFVDSVKFQKGKVAEEGSPPFLGFDVLVWFRTMTPQHRWPVAPEPSKP